MMFNSWILAVLVGVCIAASGRAHAQSSETSITLTVEGATSIAIDSASTSTNADTTASQVLVETSSTLSAAEATSTTLPEGVIYQIISPGTGRTPATTETLRLHYTLFLTDGTKVESSRDVELPLPLKLKVGQGDFIKGFEIGIAGMRIGEVRRIYIPAELGYGDTGKGPIPSDTPLLFEVELVDAV